MPKSPNALNNELTAALLSKPGLVGRFLEELGCRVRGDYDAQEFRSSCPVHKGDGGSFVLWTTGDTVPLHWSCFSRGCHERPKVKPTLLGLVRGFLGDDDEPAPQRDAERFIRAFLRGEDVQVNAVRGDPPTSPRRQLERRLASPHSSRPGMSVEEFASRLTIPSPYFIRRGFSPETLRRYLVGDTKVKEYTDDYYARAVVPVFDHAGKLVVGWSARSHWDRCPDCRLWHSPKARCPEPEFRGLKRYAKWVHADGLETGKTLYNYAAAKPNIHRARHVLVVEGPGCVWRLEEAGVSNSVALFGRSMKPEQKILLERAGGLTPVLLLDSDEAGRSGAEDIVRTLGRHFRPKVVRLWKQDVAEMSVEEVRTRLLPAIEKVLGGAA